MLTWFKRSGKNAVTLFVVVIILYTAMNLFFMAIENQSKSPNEDRISSIVKKDESWASVLGIQNRDNNMQAQMKLQVKEVVAAENGSVDLVLSVNVNELLNKIDVSKMNNGEATGNGIPYSPDFVIRNQNLCKESKGLKYIVYIHTSPGNNERRSNIRRTWGNKNLFKDGRTNIVFIMGVPIENHLKEDVLRENKIYGDIVQADFLDVYKNLTLKGIAGLKWLSLYCKEAIYAIKADDDAFVNVFKIIEILNRYNEHQNRVLCPLWGDNSMPILRDPSKCMKWCVKYNEFPGRNFFPKYCAGLSFVLSRSLVSEMYEKSKTTPFFWVDDVYITGLLIGKVDHVEYITLLPNFTLKEALAIEQYNSTSQITYYMTHIRQLSNFAVMWDLTLRKLSKDQLAELNHQVYNKFDSFRKIA